MSVAVPTAGSADCVGNLAATLPRRAGTLARILYGYAKRGLAHDLNRASAGVLAAVAEQPRRITELAELESQAQPYVTRIVMDLESRGWVERARAGADRRAVMVRITPDGREVLDQGRAIMRDVLEARLATLSEQQLAALAGANEALQQLFDLVQPGRAR